MRRMLALLVLILLTAVCVPASYAEGGTGGILFDMGNGSVEWGDNGGGTVMDATVSAAASAGLDVEFSAGRLLRVGDTEEHHVGSQKCSWNLYEWDGGWVPSTLSPDDPCPSGYLAWGFYPSSDIIPSADSDHVSQWTSFRGDPSNTGSSDSFGTREAASPVEWSTTYTTGNIDCTLVYAGGLIYHTTGGVFGSSGEKMVPWVYCIDASDGHVVWKYRMVYGVGYEVTTPVIVGDMLVVMSTEGTIYCFDRFGDGSGEGVLLHSMKIESQYPTGPGGDIVWRGRTFMTGAASAVYDSGALYFGHSDGRIMCYSVSRTAFTELWTYTPPSTVVDDTYTGERGCFYYHSPTIADVDFGGYTKRVLFIGSYEGYAYAVDASTGDAIWTVRMIDLGDDNIPHRGTPGSVSTIVPIPDGRILVSCTDGGMSCMTGYTLCVDASTGRGPGGSVCHWRLDMLITQPAVSEDGFSCYVSPSSNGQTSVSMGDGTSVPVSSMICKFGFDGKGIWCSREKGSETAYDYPLIKAPLTLADGVLYAMDYSAGTLYPSGGCLHAVDESTGEPLWAVKLTPFSSGSYSMTMPTVVGGKIFVANDYGAVYCISDIPGKGGDGGSEKERMNEFNHWSWYLLIASVIVAAVAFIVKYR